MKANSTSTQRGSVLLCLAFFLLPFVAAAATNELSSALQTGLFEEEANRNLPAAIEAYEKVAKQFDQNRALAATAIFRLGEVNRKLGKTNEAATFYQRILREFTDQDTLAALSRQNLAGMGALPRTTAAASEMSASLDALHAVQAEATTLGAEVKQLQALNREDFRRVAQQNYANPVLSKLLQDQASAEQRLVVLNKDYSPQHPEVMSAKTLIETIQKQIDTQLDGVLIGLQQKQFAAAARMKALREQADQSAVAQVSKSSDSTPITTVQDEEETEIRRIQAMIQNSPDLINAPSVEDGTPLYRAASKGQLRVATFLLDHGADVNTRAGMPTKIMNDWTPLFVAANRGHRAMVELLATRGADVNVKVRLMTGTLGGNLSGGTALHQAVEKGFQAVAEALLANKAEIDAQDTDGGAPLHRAADNGHPALTAFLVSKGANVNAANEAGQTPLMYAARGGHSDTLKKLIAAKANVNAETTEGSTALSYAAESGHLDCVTALLTAKADPNKGKVNLPLHCAIKSKSVGIVEALLKVGADANRVAKVTWNLRFPNGNEQGNRGGFAVTPLAEAMTYGQLDIIKLLLGQKADPNGKRVDGVPLIFSAVSDPEMAKAFLDAGAKPNVEDGSNPPRTPLFATADPKVISLLLTAGEDPEARYNGMTPLIFFADFGNKSEGAIEALLKGGANVNATLLDGSTALHIATRQQFKEIISLLLAYKADVNARDNQGLTPLDYATGKWQQSLGYGGISMLPPPAPRLQPQSKPNSTPVAELLRQHGGLADLPKLDRIEVTRPSLNYWATAFFGGTNSWNQFTLAEVLAQQWGFLTTKTSGGWRVQDLYHGNLWPESSLRFPEFARIKIQSPTKNGGRTTVNADLSIRDEKTGMLRDVVLQMGSVVEVPEADHPVQETWTGLSDADFQALAKAIARTVTITVSGKSTNLSLGLMFGPRPGMPPGMLSKLTTPSFMLRSVLDESKLIRSSSDLTRVKITRRESANAKPRVWVVDCSIPDKAPDLWLRDCDVIEVPEK